MKSASPSGSGTGPLMNQTNGFGYDETSSGRNVANVPAKFLPIENTAGSTLSFQLEFGPWSSA